MKKKSMIFLMLFIILTGCSQKTVENENINTEVGIVPNNEPTEIYNIEKSDDDVIVLTPEILISLSEKHETLELEDFAPYVDLQPFYEAGSISENIGFLYNGKQMYLRLNASDKTLILASYAGEVDSAVVFNANFLDLQNSEQEYSYDGSCADIRSGDIQHILDGTVEMDDYLTISLPDPLTQSGYKYWIGTHGGSSFLRKNEIEQNMTSENTGLNANTQPAGGVVILENGELAQSTEIIKELEPLIQDNITINREYVKTEQGTTWYVAYSNVEGSIISYCVFLNEREFSEKEFLDLSESIKFQKNAIY